MSARIWVVVQHREGKIHRMSREALAAGQVLAAALGGRCEAVVLGSAVAELAAELARCDLAAVHAFAAPALAEYTPGAYVAALGTALAREQPQVALFPHTYQTVDYLPRLAQAVESALVPEAIGFEVTGGDMVWRRPLFGGKLHAKVKARGSGPVLVSLQSGAYSADAVRAGSAPVTVHELSGIDADREILGVESSAGDQVDLTRAEIIVALGRGVGGPDKMGPAQELAKLLGAEVAASRPVIDSGWLPRDRQIGSSGQAVAPKLYLALGISGAIQHLVGMKASQCIVAVNKDASAPIFKVATYGVVGDLHEIVPALIQVAKERAG